LGNQDDGIAVSISGTAPTMRLLDHSTLTMSGGSQIGMALELHRGSSVDGFGNSKINGDLQVHGFSVYVQSGQVGSSVSGTTSCSKGEAFDFTAAAPGTAVALGSCL